MVEKDVVIIGGGPAGLSAGIYSAREMLDTMIIEEAIPGGQTNVTHMIENYPGFPEGIVGAELASRFREGAEKYGVEVVMGRVESVVKEGDYFITRFGSREVRSKVVIVASGVKQKSLGVPGEKEFFGRGVSVCATCDGMFFKGKEVVMVGGGDTAVKEALYLTHIASKVKVVHRREEFRAERILESALRKNEKVELYLNRIVTKIEGKDKVEGVWVKNVKTGEEEFLKADGVFIHVGVQPNTDFLSGIDGIKYDEKGFIITDENMATGIDGLFAAGDVRSKEFRQVVIAAGEGAIAALSASRFIRERERASI